MEIKCCIFSTLKCIGERYAFKHWTSHSLCALAGISLVTLCSSYNSVIKSFYKPSEENPEDSDLENEGSRKWSPSSYITVGEIPCLERYEHNRRSEGVHCL
jgi:hypothetical protein